MNSLSKLLLAAGLAVGIAGGARAALVDVTKPFDPTTKVTVAFAGKEASDTDNLNLGVTPSSLLVGGTLLFNNQTAAVGDVKVLGDFTAPWTVALSDMTRSTGFVSGQQILGTDSVPFYAFRQTKNWQDIPFLVDNPTFAATVIAALGTSDLTWVGVEDRLDAATRDWNDVIYAFKGFAPLPEPASLALLGAGILGLGLSRLRKA